MVPNKYLVGKSNSKLFAANIDQIIIFLHCHKVIYIKRSTFAESETLNKLTKTDLNSFFYIDVGKKVQNPPPSTYQNNISSIQPEEYILGGNKSHPIIH